MHEVFPLLAGGLIGLAVQRIRVPSLRAIVLVFLCACFGVLASYLSGELVVSWGFISVDTVLVWIGALVSVVVATLWRRHVGLRAGER